MKGSLLYRTN